MTVGEHQKLTATVTPDNATNKNVTWSNSDESVATVDSEGNVAAVSTGTATITVTTIDGNKTATCTVTVTTPEPPKLSMNPPKTLGKLVNNSLLVKPEENELVTETIESETEKIEEQIQSEEIKE